MSGRFLIDVTDPRFLVAPNDDVMSFVRRTNPFAHSDLGSLLLALGKGMPGAAAYCPSFATLAYVVLHTAANRIFAIAFGQRGLAFRLDAGDREGALADGAAPAPDIGPDWVCFDPWAMNARAAETRERLRRWGERALAAATSAGT